MLQVNEYGNKHKHEVEKRKKNVAFRFRRFCHFGKIQSDEHIFTLSTNLYVMFGLLSDIYTDPYSN